DGGFSLPGSDRISASALRKAAGEDARVTEFYEQRQWEPAWSGGRAGELLEAIGASEKHGIDAGRFLAIIGEAPDAAAEEAALTRAAIAYGDALARGMIDPKKVYGLYTLPRPKVDVVAGLQTAVEAGEVGDWLESLAPQDEEYR